MVSMSYRTPALALISGLLCLSFAGCSTSPKTQNVAATEGIQAVVKELDASRDDIDTVLSAIDQLRAAGDMKAAFANYTAGVENVRKGGQRVRERREAMQARRDEYITQWQRELETIENPEVKAALIERKKKVAANYDKIATDVSAVRDDYDPFVKNLEEIEKALTLDLNSAGVAALKQPLDQARVDGVRLQASIATLQGELNAIIGRMSPATATDAPSANPPAVK